VALTFFALSARCSRSPSSLGNWCTALSPLAGVRALLSRGAGGHVAPVCHRRPADSAYAAWMPTPAGPEWYRRRLLSLPASPPPLSRSGGAVAVKGRHGWSWPTPASSCMTSVRRSEQGWPRPSYDTVPAEVGELGVAIIGSCQGAGLCVPDLPRRPAAAAAHSARSSIRRPEAVAAPRTTAPHWSLSPLGVHRRPPPMDFRWERPALWPAARRALA